MRTGRQPRYYVNLCRIDSMQAVLLQNGCICTYTCTHSCMHISVCQHSLHLASWKHTNTYKSCTHEHIKTHTKAILNTLHPQARIQRWTHALTDTDILISPMHTLPERSFRKNSVFHLLAAGQCSARLYGFAGS